MVSSIALEAHGVGCLDIAAIAKNFWRRIVFFHAARWRRFFRCCRAASNFRSRSA